MAQDGIARSESEDPAPTSTDVERSVLLYRIDPERHAAARVLARIVARTGAAGAEISWTPTDLLQDPLPYVRVGRQGPCAEAVALGGDEADRSWFVRLAGRPTVAAEHRDLAEAWAWVARLEPEPPPAPAPVASTADVVAEIACEGTAQGWSLDGESARAAAAWLRARAPEVDDDPERRAVRAFADALELADLEGLHESLMTLGGRAHDADALERSVSLYRHAYEVATVLGDTGRATQSARFVARSLRKLGQTDEALRWYDQAAELARFDRDATTLAAVLDGLARTHLARGSTPKARAVLSDAWAAARASGDSYAVGSLHLTAGYVARLGGHLAEAAAEYWCAARALEDRGLRGHAAIGLGTALTDGGQLEAAEDAYRLGLSLLHPEDASNRVLALDALAYLAALRGDDEAYERRHARVAAEMASVTPLHRAQILFYRARALVHLGRAAEAAAALEASIAFARDHGFTQYSERSEIELESLPDPPAVDDTTPRIVEWLSAETAGATVGI